MDALTEGSAPRGKLVALVNLVPHVPAWAAVPIFALGLGLANCTRWGRM